MLTRGARTEVELGFSPVATAAGDIEGDGVDEVVVLGRAGEIAICAVGTKSCQRRLIEGIVGKDLAVADVDGNEEAVVLGDQPHGDSAIYVLNLDAKTSGQPELITLATGRTLTRLAAGDLPGKRPSKIVALEDGGYLDLRADTLRFFSQSAGKLGEADQAIIATDVLDDGRRIEGNRTAHRRRPMQRPRGG